MIKHESLKVRVGVICQVNDKYTDTPASDFLSDIIDQRLLTEAILKA
jgi:hypothetical protein